MRLRTFLPFLLSMPGLPNYASRSVRFEINTQQLGDIIATK